MGRMNTDYHDPEYVRKQREAKLGNKNPMWGLRGEKSPRWKGGLNYRPQLYIKKGHNPNSIGRPFKKGDKIRLGCHHTEEAKEKNRQKHLGKPSGFKGKHLSLTQKKLLSQTRIKWWKNIGSKLSKEQRKIYGRPGEKSPSWKGGISSLNNRIRSLVEFKEWRYEVFARDNFTCQNCGDNKGGNLRPHHKKSFAEILAEFLQEYDQFSPYDDIDTLVRLAMKYEPFWNVNNGITLCRDCHKLTKSYAKRLKIKGR